VEPIGEANGVHCGADLQAKNDAASGYRLPIERQTRAIASLEGDRPGILAALF
jgi:hypothetical protein